MDPNGKPLNEAHTPSDKYWQTFYAKHLAPNFASPFAKEVAEIVGAGESLLDVGCGNGRDTKYFVSKGIGAEGLDPNNWTSEPEFPLHKQTLEDFENKHWDNIYSRFFIHAVPVSEEVRLYNYARRNANRIFIECRSNKEKFEGNHYRRFIDLNDLKDRLYYFIPHFEFTFEEGRFSEFNGENPLLIRAYGVKV